MKKLVVFILFVFVVFSCDLPIDPIDPDTPNVGISAPIVTGTSPTYETTPTWTWNTPDGTVEFRYSFKDGSDWVTTTDNTFTPVTALSVGSYTLYVQAKDSSDNWSESGSKTIVVDQSIPVGPIQISSIEGLINMALDLEGDYVLLRDLDFLDAGSYDSGVVDSSLTSGEGFEPIGVSPDWIDGWYVDGRFMGTFDGGGYSISNLYINRPDSYESVGLFGAIAPEARIKDVTLTDVDVTGSFQVGGLIGIVEDITCDFVLENCSVSGTITGTYNSVGGIIGHMENFQSVDSQYSGDTVLSGCTVSVNVSGGSGVGGAFGYIDFRYDNFTLSISDCTVNSGSTIYGSGSNFGAGGLVGTILDVSLIENCFVDAEVSGRCSGIGGLVGYVSGFEESSIIQNCISVGNVSVDSTASSVDMGGLVGQSISVSVENCHSEGNLVAPSGVTGGFIGGLIGYAGYNYPFNGETFHISECTSEGSVTFGRGKIGGFIGSSIVDISDCYSLGQVENISDFSTLGGFIGHNLCDISNCYSMGDVSGLVSSACGGFAAENDMTIFDYSVTITDCIAFCDSVTVGGTNNMNVDRFIGSYIGTPSGAYVNSEMTLSADLASPPTNGYEGMDLTLSEFQNSASTVYNTWDFATIWVENAGSGPELRNKAVLYAALAP